MPPFFCGISKNLLDKMSEDIFPPSLVENAKKIVVAKGIRLQKNV